MSDFIGPALPSHLQQDVNPAIGPQIPVELVDSKTSSKDIADTKPIAEDDVSFGPALPPELLPECGSPPRPCVIGPLLPAHLRDNEMDNERIQEEEEILEGGEVIGPLPPGNNDTQVSERELRKRDIEARSKLMKERLDPKAGGMSKPVREEWMMKLPDEIRPIGVSMTPRKFRTTYIDPGDRSVWTDTPAEKARKLQEGEKKKKVETEDLVISARDRKLAAEVEKYNKEHRKESLVDIHRKRKAKEQPEVKERKPFNRDTDLQLPQNLITSTKRKALIKDSSKSLESKFTHGKQSFL